MRRAMIFMHEFSLRQVVFEGDSSMKILLKIYKGWHHLCNSGNGPIKGIPAMLQLTILPDMLLD
jgi:hypothetical protein